MPGAVKETAEATRIWKGTDLKTAGLNENARVSSFRVAQAAALTYRTGVEE